MMTLRQRIFIGLSIVVTLIAVLLWYILYTQKAESLPSSASQTKTTQTSTSTGGIQKSNTTQTIERPVITLPAYSEEMYVRQLAAIFVERFGSYSNQNDNRNTKDTLVMATESMQTWMKSHMHTESVDYNGVVTKVLSTRVLEKTATAATVVIQTQQVLEEKKAGTTDAPTHVVVQKNGKVTLVKVNASWKIDGLYWDK
jgi:hypothetical protein